MTTKTILVVEDEDSIRENIVEILSANQFNVIDAINGSIGYKMAIENQPDLIISDVAMPEMDGIELLGNVRSHKEICNTPFLFLTANSELTDLRKGMDLGADDYLFKPFSVKQLLTAINTRLEKQQKVKDELDQKIDKIVRQLNNTLSHEYNTPLNGILGFSNLMLGNFDSFSSSKIKEFIAIINDSGKRLKKTFDKTMLFRYFLSLKDEERNQLKDTKSASVINLSHFESMGKELANRTRRSNALNMNIEPAIVCLNEEYLSVIIEELLENSLVYADDDTHVEINGKIDNENYILSFYNRGRGFKPEDIDRIGPFVQFELSKYEQQGSGLGLYNVKTICEFFNIGFAVESNYGEYAKIIISFKLCK